MQSRAAPRDEFQAAIREFEDAIQGPYRASLPLAPFVYLPYLCRAPMPLPFFSFFHNFCFYEAEDGITLQRALMQCEDAVLGETFSLADIIAAPMLWRLLTEDSSLGMSRAEYPKIYAWMDSVTKRPSFSKCAFVFHSSMSVVSAKCIFLTAQPFPQRSISPFTS